MVLSVPLPPRLRRLAAFVAASLALHAATLVTVSPSGGARAPFRGAVPSEPLHATIEPRPASGYDAQSPAAARELETRTDSRQGVRGGADMPFPEKWYTASELDVRAAPLGEVFLDYPEELEGTGIPGRVHLLLFIDERGVVRRMHIVDAEPAKLFDKAATRAWQDVRFSPALKGGVAVKSQKLLELDFRP
ncbi:MAG TPA: TonB family protein [Burkholderiales bacterium]|nr:TonB family protein [Burkholderiales bacterium]